MILFSAFVSKHQKTGFETFEYFRYITEPVMCSDDEMKIYYQSCLVVINMGYFIAKKKYKISTRIKTKFRGSEWSSAMLPCQGQGLTVQSADALSQNKERERENSLAITMAAILS